MSPEQKKIKTLKFVDLEVSYDSAKPLISNFNLNLEKPRITRFGGEPGSGKSTILKVMAGLLIPKKGEYKINGESVLDLTFSEFIPFRLRIGYAFEMGGLLSNRTISENLQLPLAFHQVCAPDEIKEKVEYLLEMFELTEVANERPSEVSGSRRKAAVVARSLVNEPDLLILDDPTTGLSENNRTNLANFIIGKRDEGKLDHVILVSDDQKFCKELVEENIVLSHKETLRAA